MAAPVLAQVTVERQFQWLSAPALWVIFLVLVPAAVAVTWALYRAERGDLTPLWRAVLGGTRMVLWLLVLCLMFEPVISHVTREERAAHVLVLADVSHSMNFSDDWASHAGDSGAVRILGPEITGGPAQIARIDVVKRVLGSEGGGWLRRLAGKGVVRLGAFHRKNRQLTAEDIPRGAQDVAQALQRVSELDAGGEGGDETHLANAVQEAVLALRGRRVAAVVVLSDWQQTGGSLALEELPAHLMRPDGVIPVMAVGMGSPQWPRDTAIVDMDGPTQVLAGDTAEFTVTVRAQGCDPGVTTKVELVVDGTPVHAHYPVLLGDGRNQDVVLRHPFRTQGRFEVVARMQALPGEVDLSNNEALREIEVVERKIKIVYVEDPPRWDYRYLKNFLVRDPTVAIQCFLVSADARFRQETSLHPPLEPLTRFPGARAELFQYDVLIIGDVDPARVFSNQELETIRAFVSEGAGGVVFIAGENYNPRAFAHTPLADVLPVELEEFGGGARGMREAAEEAFRVRLTPEGIAHPIMRLVPDEDANRELWEDLDGLEYNSLPGFWWFAPVSRLKKGAIALGVHPQKRHMRHGPRVIFACQIYGKGRVFFSAVDSTWRWRAGVGDVYFKRFWGQVIRYAAASRLRGDTARYQVRVDRPVCHPGEQIVVTARVLDEELRPSMEREWRLMRGSVAREDERSALVLTQDDPTRPGTFTGAIEAGGFGTYVVFFPESPEARATFRVVVPAKESRDVRLNEAAATAVAAATGGRYYTVRDVHRLPDDVNPVTQEIAVTALPDPRWNRWWVIVAVVAVASAEWTLRKLRRLL